jgi:threonyl-tRNA synthetase
MNANKIKIKGKPFVELDAESLTNLDALKQLKIKGLNNVVAVKVDGESRDLLSPVISGTELEPIFLNTEEGLEIMRHSTSHVMAMAVRELFPGTKVTIGPAIENGFYYDFEYERPFREEDLKEIEQKMKEIVEMDLPFKREEMSSQEALDFFMNEGEDYKVELIRDLGEEKVTLYTQGSFTDLCRGPHVPSTGRIKAFQLNKVAGAYWRGDENRAMLSRIYGVAFSDRKHLREYFRKLEEAKKRDHIKLGHQLGLFSSHEEIGAGMIVWHPKGAMLRHILEEFEIREHLKRGYELARGPQILKTDLWKKSG